MKISYYTVDGNLDRTNGYGNAGFQLILALQKAGHEVPFDDETAPIQISFCQPNHYKFHEGQYKIGYTPWESTELPDGWLEKMNACDEIWATSDWVKGVYERAGVLVPIKVVHHGLDPKWKPVHREHDGVTHFFHHGEPALRKGGQMTLDAFRAAFGDREDVHLTFKANSQHYLRAWHDGKFSVPEYNNVTIITKLYFENELVDLYNRMHCMVYPSYGEGFGLIPLQALGTGMPVISTTAWAPYRRVIENAWTHIPVRVDRSLWPVHPGYVYYPEFRSLVRLFKEVDSDIKACLEYFEHHAPSVHKEFDWETIAKDVSSHLEKVQESR
jgi:glycosyltransferase involved in cell wall biosynthesis